MGYLLLLVSYLTHSWLVLKSLIVFERFEQSYASVPHYKFVGAYSHQYLHLNQLEFHRKQRNPLIRHPRHQYFLKEWDADENVLTYQILLETINAARDSFLLDLTINVNAENRNKTN